MQVLSTITLTLAILGTTLAAPAPDNPTSLAKRLDTPKDVPINEINCVTDKTDKNMAYAIALGWPAQNITDSEQKCSDIHQALKDGQIVFMNNGEFSCGMSEEVKLWVRMFLKLGQAGPVNAAMRPLFGPDESRGFKGIDWNCKEP